MVHSYKSYFYLKWNMLLNHNIYIHVFQNHEMKLILKYTVNTQSAHVHVTQVRISLHGTSVEDCYRTGNQELKVSKMKFNIKKNHLSYSKWYVSNVQSSSLSCHLTSLWQTTNSSTRYWTTCIDWNLPCRYL